MREWRLECRPGWVRALLFCGVALVFGFVVFGSASPRERVSTVQDPATTEVANAAKAEVRVMASVAPPAPKGTTSTKQHGSSLPSGSYVGNGPEYLVKVRVTSPEGWELLRSLGAELYLRGDGYAVVKLDRDHLTSLDSKGLAWRTLAPGIPQNLFYFVPGRDSQPLNLSGALVLDRNEEGLVAVATSEVAADATRSGFLAVSLDRTWPIRLAGFHGLQFVHEDEVIRDQRVYNLTREVNPDSLAAYIQHLENYGTRHSDSPQVLIAGRWLKNTLGRFGCRDTLFQAIDPVKQGPEGDGNIIGVNPGRTRPQFRILVGGHYDSTTNGEPVPPVIEAPGADDNASGTAGGLEIARLTAGLDLDATVEYVFFSGEEQGLRGSRRFAAELVRDGVPTDKLFFFNMDMIGNTESFPGTVQLFDDDDSRPIAELAARLTRAYTNIEPYLAGSSGRSDHASLQQVGYAAIFALEGDFSRQYHSREDLLIHLEMDYAAEVVRMVMATVLHLATISDPPTAVTVVETDEGGIEVEWTHSLDADLLGYHVEVLDDEGEVTEKVFVKENHAVFGPGAIGLGSRVRVRPEDVLGEGEASEPVLVGGAELLTTRTSSNPTSGHTEFDVFVPGSGPPVKATVAVVDASGRLVRTLHTGTLSRGSHHMEWDGRFENGDAVPPGIYFYLVEAGGLGRESGKIMVVR